jgi:hypothetical protein
VTTTLGTRLGTRLGTGLGNSALKDMLSMMTSADGYYDASNVAPDGKTLVDYLNPSRTFATGGSISVTPGDANFRGKPYFTLPGTLFWDSNQAPSYWAPMHGAGTGGTLIIVHKAANPDSADRYLFTTSDASPAQTGLSLLSRGTASDNYGCYVVNGAGYALPLDPATTLSITDPTYLDAQVVSGANNFVLRKKGATVHTNTLASPSNAAPTRTARIGGNNSANGRFLLRSVIYLQRPASAAERALIQAAILDDSGVAA